MASGFDFGDVLKQKILSASVTFAGQVLKFDYKPGLIDEDWQDASRSAQEADDLEGLIGVMCTVVVNWDATINGKPLPLEADKIYAAKPPLLLLGMINDKMAEESTNGGKGAKKARSGR